MSTTSLKSRSLSSLVYLVELGSTSPMLISSETTVVMSYGSAFKLSITSRACTKLLPSFSSPKSELSLSAICSKEFLVHPDSQLARCWLFLKWSLMFLKLEVSFPCRGVRGEVGSCAADLSSQVKVRRKENEVKKQKQLWPVWYVWRKAVRRDAIELYNQKINISITLPKQQYYSSVLGKISETRKKKEDVVKVFWYIFLWILIKIII